MMYTNEIPATRRLKNDSIEKLPKIEDLIRVFPGKIKPGSLRKNIIR